MIFLIVLSLGLLARLAIMILMNSTKPFFDFEAIGIMLMIAFFSALGTANRQ